MQAAKAAALRWFCSTSCCTYRIWVTHMVFRIVLKLVFALALVVIPPAAKAQDGEVVATVGNARVTVADVQQRLSTTGGPRPDELLDEAIERVIDELVAELMVERQLARMPQIDRQLSAAINRARRQVMLEFFLQDRIERTEAPDEQIEEFIAANPQYFGDRASFWLNQFLVMLPEDEDRAPYDAALAELREGPVTPEQILVFQRRLLDADVSFQRQAVWRSSEQLSEDRLERLERLYASGEQIEEVVAGQQAEVLILLQRVSDPVDPEAQRSQIARGIVQQSIAAQRDALIAELAESARQMEEAGQDIEQTGAPDVGAPDDEASEMPPEFAESVEAPAPEAVQTSRQWRPWMFVVFGGLGLMLPLVLWSGTGVTRSLQDNAAWLLRARLGVAAVVMLGLGAMAWVVSRLSPLLGLQASLALGIGGIVMGVLIAASWGRDQPTVDPDPKQMVRRFVVIVGLQGVLFVAYAAFRLGWV